MEPKSFIKKYEDVLTKIYNNDIQSFLVPPTVNISDNENITIDFSNELKMNNESMINTQNKKNGIYICGAVRNCSDFLNDVFKNIDKIIALFNDYKIIISYDNMNDNSLDILHKKKAKYNMELIHVLENEDIFHRDMRSQRISNARNEYLKYIRNEKREDFEYIIVMDMDDVCAGKINIDVISYHVNHDSLWDAISFNKPHYYDIWALSIEPYLLSCWHFPYGKEIVHTMENYVSEKLHTLDKNDLLECQSAFNGFAIYKKSKFIDCQYNWRIKNIHSYVNDNQVKKNEEALGKPFSMNTSYHSNVHPMTDCEHRQFHMEAIRKHNAKIRISPMYLFT
jgi:hypothetical protein